MAFGARLRRHRSARLPAIRDTYKGGLSLDTREDVLKAEAAVPGKSAASELIRRVATNDPVERMPPEGPALTEKEVRTLAAWVDGGLAWEPGFSFKPTAYAAPLKPRRVTPPPAKPGRDHPIDRIVDAYLAANSVPPRRPLDDAAFARRAYLDLIGLPPAPQELAASLADARADKRANLVRALLAEERAYADHWLTFWNDLLRNEYKGTGYIDGGRKRITVRLYQSLLGNKPYGRFARELVSPTPDPEGFAKGVRRRGAVNASQPPKGMTPERFAARHAAFRGLLKRSPVGELAGDHRHESMLRSIENARRLLTSAERDAFDLTKEPRASHDAYNTGRFGLGCLLARRLTEAGARFIEVTTEYVPFLHWDTHENGHATYARMKREIDRPVARLVLGLEARGLLDRTLVVLASEFSRDMMIEGIPGSTAKDQSRAKADRLGEPKHYGLHRHFTGSGSVLLFGGGMKRGFLYGETAAERPLVATKHPVTIRDLHATILTAMGVSPNTAFDVEKRPFYATDDGKGVAVKELFARGA